MKIVCALLVVVLLVHLQCIGSCLAESAQPPCHPHQSQHDANSSCSEQATDSRPSSAAAGKCTLEVPAILPVLAGALTFNEVTLLLNSPRTIRQEFQTSQLPRSF